MPTSTIKYFDYNHLPLELQRIAKPICELALDLEHMINDSPEKSAGMRKLLEAKDCFVRAAILFKEDTFVGDSDHEKDDRIL